MAILTYNEITPKIYRAQRGAVWGFKYVLEADAKTRQRHEIKISSPDRSSNIRSIKRKKSEADVESRPVKYTTIIAVILVLRGK